MIDAAEHLGLAYSIAARYTKRRRLPPQVQMEDVQSAALVGLVEASQSYRDDGGARFSTHASTRIHGAITDMLRCERLVGPLVRSQSNYQKWERVDMPAMHDDDEGLRQVEVRDLLNVYWARFQTRLTQQERAALWLRYGPENYSLTLEEIGQVLNLSQSRVCQVLRQSRNALRGERRKGDA